MYIKINETNYYAYTGTHEFDAAKETLVFLHGACMDHSVWSQQSRYFAYHGYNVIALDLPGHNFSDGELLTTVEAMSAWLMQIIDALCDSAVHLPVHLPVHLIGHSMGALVALQTAANYGANYSDGGAGVSVKSLSLIGFSYPMGVTPQLMDAAKNNPSKAYSMMTQWSHTSKIGGEPIPGFWSAGMQKSMMENSADGAIVADLQACNHYCAGESALNGVDCPILWLSGAQDKMAPAQGLATLLKASGGQRKLAAEAERNDRAEIILIQNCGHNVMSESPDGVLDALKTFIGKNTRSRHL